MFASVCGAIAEGERRFSDCRNPQIFKLDRQALLVNRFKKSAPLLVIHLEAGAPMIA